MIRLIACVAAVASFLALAPTAWLVAKRTMQHLDWPQWIAIAAAVAVELLGLAIAVTVLVNWSYNRSKRKTDPAAPIVLPAILVAVYFVAAELLTVVLDVATGPVTVAKGSQAIFPILGLAGMFCLATRYDQAQRVAEAKAAKAERTETRKLANSAKVMQQSVATLPFACKVSGCTKTTATKNGMNAHMKAHKKETKE
jgi:hypothetical protein